MAAPKLLEVKAFPAFRLWLRSEDGAQGEVDLSDFVGRGVFSAWNQPGTFEAVQLEPHGALSWGDDIDLCADAIYLRLTGKAPEEVFPVLAKAAVDA